MTDWRQRLATAGAPDAQLELELRYRFCAPLLEGAAVWCDLGADPAAAAAALSDQELPGRVVVAGPGAEEAAELGPSTVAVEADLADPAGLHRVRAAVAEGDGPRVVTCLDALEALEHFAGLVELLVELGAKEATTVVLSIPDDGGVDELLRLLPDDHVLARQVALHGSAIGLARGARSRHDLRIDVDVAEVAASHVIAVFGSGATAPVPAAEVAPADVSARRAWERGLEADAMIGRSLLAERA